MDPLRMNLFQTYPLQKVVPHVKTKIRVAISSMKNTQEFSGSSLSEELQQSESDEHPHQTMSYLLLLSAWRKQQDSSEKCLTSILSLTFHVHLHLGTQAFKQAVSQDAE